MTKTSKQGIREKLRRLNALAAPDGWERDINFDVPWWRFAVIGAFFPAVLLGLRLLTGGGLTLGAWAMILLAGLPLWLIPPLRALYLRRRAHLAQKSEGGES